MALRRAGSGIAALSLALLLAGCSQPPREVVDDYFRALRGSPARSLILTTDAFHRRHGVRRVPPQRAGEAPSEADARLRNERPEVALARARLGWLLMIKMRAFHLVNDQIRVEHVSEAVDGDHATVVTRISAPGTTPFLQTFRLLRSEIDGSFRIDEIVQEDVRLGSRGIAYAAYPSKANHDAAIAHRISVLGPDAELR